MWKSPRSRLFRLSIKIGFYEDDAYRQEHPSVYIADDAGLHRYDIFAVYAADVKDRVYQELDVEDEETRP